MRRWALKFAFLVALLGLRSGALRAATVETGYIQVTNAKTDASLGYLANALNGFGEYSYLTQSSADFLYVSFTLDARFSLSAVNGLSSDHPYVGAIVGYYSTGKNLHAGSANYDFLGGTDETAVNSPPVSGGNTFTDSAGIQEDIESAIWSLSASDALTAHWVNKNSSMPATYIEYSSTTPAFVLTGGRKAFRNKYGGELVDFTFVPTSIVSSNVPEPSGLVLIGLGVVLLSVRRCLLVFTERCN